MKTIRELKTLDFSSYFFFKEMINILDIEPKYFMINDFKGCKDGLTLFNLCYSDENGVPYIVFNNIECIFKKSGIYSYLIFCESDKNKDMINNYSKITDWLKKEILSWIDEEDSFTLDDDFLKFRFTTDDNLTYNEKINISVCVIPLSSIIKRKNNYYPNLKKIFL